MGLIKAALGSFGGVMADQWKEYFYCEAIPENVLAVKGQKKTSRPLQQHQGRRQHHHQRLGHRGGRRPVYAHRGSGQDRGYVRRAPASTPMTSPPSPPCSWAIWAKASKTCSTTSANRFTFGGEAPKDQRIYYFNTKELIGNKYGTPSPVPFRVVDQRAGIDIDVGIRCFGEYSYRISNPMLFYTNVCGNVSEDYTRDRLDSQLKTELLTALQPAFAKIGENGHPLLRSCPATPWSWPTP